MKRPAVVRESIPYISKIAIGNAGMECRNSKKVPPSCPHLFRKGKNQYKLKKTTEKLRTPENPYRAEMAGDSCMARAVIPSAEAAVDHAATELIGHDGRIGDTGFLCSEIIEYYAP